MRNTYAFTGETKKIRDWKQGYGFEMPKNKWNTPEALGEREIHRIVALPGNKWANAGTIGGWIEHEANLQDGAWVADEACVYGDSLVEGNTLVEDNAAVYGNARLCGTVDSPLILSFDMIVHGGCWCEVPLSSACAPWTTQITSMNTFRVGCQDKPFEYWQQHYKALICMGVKNSPLGVNRNMIREMARFFNLCCMETMHTECTVDVEAAASAYFSDSRSRKEFIKSFKMLKQARAGKIQM